MNAHDPYGAALTDYLWAAIVPDVSDDAQTWLAYAGKSASPSIYSSVPADMRGTPKNKKKAYEMAVYWLMLASRRADYEGLKVDQNHLYALGDALYNRFGAKSSMTVLSEASTAIAGSTLPPSDKDEIGGALDSAWWGVVGREGLRWGAIAGVAGGVGYWIWQRKQ